MPVPGVVCTSLSSAACVAVMHELHGAGFTQDSIIIPMVAVAAVV